VGSELPKPRMRVRCMHGIRVGTQQVRPRSRLVVRAPEIAESPRPVEHHVFFERPEEREIPVEPWKRIARIPVGKEHPPGARAGLGGFPRRGILVSQLVVEQKCLIMRSAPSSCVGPIEEVRRVDVRLARRDRCEGSRNGERGRWRRRR
jgi:hypothetical protein